MLIRLFVFILLMMNVEAASSGSGIIFSENIKNSHKLILERDLSRFQTLTLTSQNSNDQKTDFFFNQTSNELLIWLKSRVNFILAEKDVSTQRLALGLSLFLINDFQNYPNQLSNIQTGSINLFQQQNDVSVIMSNIGTGVYQLGKTDGKLYGVKVSQGFLKKQLRIPVTSPRVGILKIGEGLFDKDFLVNSENVNAFSNSISRLSTLFHEARHSDGNGKSLGFSHIKCPSGHDLQGFMACDNSKNGAYSVGADLTKILINNCSTCSDFEKEILKLKYLDEKSRILSDAVLDESPESI